VLALQRQVRGVSRGVIFDEIPLDLRSLYESRDRGHAVESPI
jgi:hypothetical protein